MALLDIIFQAQPKKASIGTMQIDASLSESHNFTGTVTENEIESGDFVQDHIAIKPIRLNLQGLISDSPLTLFSPFVGTAIGEGGQIVNDVGGGFLAGTAATVGLGLGLGSLGRIVQQPNRTPEEAFRYLRELFKNRAKFEVITKLTSYKNMVFETLTVPRNSRIGGSLQFTATLVEIRQVQSQVVEVPRFVKDDPKVNPNKSVNQGKKAAQVLEDESSRASIARRFVEAYRGD